VVGIIAYNEAEAIYDLVRDFKAQDDVIEVIVVDNNSTDSTAQLAAAAGARVVTERKQGYGWACIRALQEGALTPGADVIALAEGDGTFDPADLAKFQSYIGQADMVVGTRVVNGLVEHGSQMDYFFTWGNMAVGTLLRFRFWNAQFLGTTRLTDVGCTYRVIRRDALVQILPDLVIGGHHFSPHMLLVALSRRLSVIEIPVTFRRRLGVSKGAGASFRKGFAVGLVMIWHILAYRPGVQPRQAIAPQPLPVAEELGVEISHASR
jgi:glycosyltransferase involved in cell wall biosynthesis